MDVIKRAGWIGTLLLTVSVACQALANDPRCCPPPQQGILKRCQPVGGWHPYGPMLGWWNPHCFPRCGAPDDYCRKNLPNLCWPNYPPFYQWGPPEICFPRCHKGGLCTQPP